MASIIDKMLGGMNFAEDDPAMTACWTKTGHVS